MLENARFLFGNCAFSSIYICLADEPSAFHILADKMSALHILADKMSALQLFGVVSYEVVIRITFGN